MFFRDVIKQKELNHSQYFIKYPDEEMLILAQSLKSGNKERTIEVLDLVLVDIYKNKENGIHLQVLVADVLNLMLKTATELELENTTPIYQETAKLSDFKNYNDVKMVLNSIAHLICNSVQKEDKKISNNIEQQVVEFIYSNYNSLDISLEQIASEFNISISYVSKLIKDETGESFSSIIQNLRMDLFKDLLLNTDKPIKNLVKEIGYYDVSNFTRKFKNENNITPSQYRKKYSN